ncbi:coiled-coil domain-containing protein 172 isoform X2 [Triplophysa dalaica]|uniref:coiled-coil domain-containing protein 172 isoform X2 n=1 Tax=Triplophysa dalaica TaxID=1582913 RepID=UPI0024DF329F|nr:coiled-coil domain-containing protein 172 isoform X2 [Triplophysa dalaica]
MSIDSLFEHILLTEQQVSENIRQLHEVHSGIKTAQDKINSSSQKLEKAQRELDKKDKLKRESLEERETFLKEMITFNGEFNLMRNRNVFLTQTQSKIQSLEQEAETLNKEIELLRQNNPWLSSMEAEKRSLETELQDLQSQLTDIDKDLTEAVTLTVRLKRERLMVREKPLKDSTFVRLKKELELYKEDELLFLRDALSCEIQSLRLKLSQNAILC